MKWWLHFISREHARRMMGYAKHSWWALSLVLGASVGAGLGVGVYTFWSARGASYLTNDPAACANCHVMQGHFDAWAKSSHHGVAVCNDCHTPHNLVGKYYVKGLNGYHHSLAFTTQRFHEPIEIKPFNRAVAEAACRRCHEDVVQCIDAGQAHTSPLECIRCHANVGHME